MSTVNRDKTGKFVKGNKSGGRKQIPPDIKVMFEAASPDAVQLLIDTMNDEEQDRKLRVDCADKILDRHIGKPKQIADVDVNQAIRIVIGLDDNDD